MKRNAYPVRDMHTGETWPSILACAKDINAHVTTLHQAIREHRACKGRWIVIANPEPVVCACCGEKLERNLVKAGRPELAAEVAAMVG